MTFLISVPFSIVSAEYALNRRTRLSLSAFPPLPCADAVPAQNSTAGNSIMIVLTAMRIDYRLTFCLNQSYSKSQSLYDGSTTMYVTSIFFLMKSSTALLATCSVATFRSRS